MGIKGGDNRAGITRKNEAESKSVQLKLIQANMTLVKNQKSIIIGKK